MEDLHGEDPTLSGKKLTVKYAPQKEDKVKIEVKKLDETHCTELPLGEVIHGAVKTWKEDRSFGYITVEGGGPDVYFNAKALEFIVRPVDPGLKVSFEVKWGEEHK